jgi:hypothetical protein
MTATPDDVDPIAVALVVTRVLDALGIANTVGGSIASSYAGEPRSTVDIDIVAALQASHVPALAAALSDAFYLDEDAVRRAVRERSSTPRVYS